VVNKFGTSYILPRVLNIWDIFR